MSINNIFIELYRSVEWAFEGAPLKLSDIISINTNTNLVWAYAFRENINNPESVTETIAPFVSNLQLSMRESYYEKAAPEIRKTVDFVLSRLPGDCVVRTHEGSSFILGEWEGLFYTIQTGGAFCKKVQVGTEIVEEPDPEYIKSAPMVEVEKPIHRWRCVDSLQDVEIE